MFSQFLRKLNSRIFRNNNKKTSTKTISVRQVSSRQLSVRPKNRALLLGGACLFALGTVVTAYSQRAAEKSENKKSEEKNKGQQATSPTEQTDSRRGTPLVRVVLTGGPCAGKSTALADIMEHMTSLGWRVYCVPEMATILLGGGCKVGDTPEKLYAFQTNLMKLQMSLEDHFINIARSTGEPSVIIMDRGVLDARAYMSQELWDMALDDNAWTSISLRDNRYDGVIHMVTAARGAEKFYTTANNSVRRETIEEARAIDYKLLEAWVGHPKLRVVDNTESFKEKVRRVNEAVCQMAGVPAPKKSERRFLLTGPPDAKLLPGRREEFKVELKFLKTESGNSGRLKRREQNGASSYSYSNHSGDGTWERIITSREYLSLVKQVDDSKKTVKKDQLCFLHEGQAFIVNHYKFPSELWILETHTDGEKAPVNIPPSVKVVSEVTGEAKYSALGLLK